VISAPTWLSFDAQTLLLSGTAVESGTLTLQVTDSIGRVGERSYPLAARDKCWLAYISSETTPAQLHFYDPMLQHRLALPTSATETASVTDFRFSPDGRFVAYRLDGARLVLAEAPTWREQAVDFGGVVTQYAWSPDSSVLAVAFTDSASAYLGGLRVVPASGASADGGVGPGSTDGGLTGFVQLSAIPATVESALLWFGGGKSVAFHALSAGPGTARIPHLAQLGDAGFEPEIVIDSGGYYGESVELRSAENGFFAIDELFGVDFYQVPADVSTPDDVTYLLHFTAFVAPSGRYTVHDDAGDLTLFSAIDPTSPLAAASGCPMLLSWAQDKERIACVANTDGGSEVRIFELAGASGPLAMSAVRGEYAYLEGAAYERRRAFSASGRWFAFATDSHLYLADLEGGSPRLEPVTPPQENDATLIEFAFSPDEQWLLEQRGGALLVHGLKDGSVTPFSQIDDPLDPPATCLEGYMAAPGSWCGNVRNPTRFDWSPDSRFAVFLTAAGKLQVVDPSYLPYFDLVTVNNPCGPTCVGQFGFQP
jgi:hypothetical protein